MKSRRCLAEAMSPRECKGFFILSSLCPVYVRFTCLGSSVVILPLQKEATGSGRLNELAMWSAQLRSC